MSQLYLWCDSFSTESMLCCCSRPEYTKLYRAPFSFQVFTSGSANLEGNTERMTKKKEKRGITLLVLASLRPISLLKIIIVHYSLFIINEKSKSLNVNTWKYIAGTCQSWKSATCLKKGRVKKGIQVVKS